MVLGFGWRVESALLPDLDAEDAAGRMGYEGGISCRFENDPCQWTPCQGTSTTKPRNESCYRLRDYIYSRQAGAPDQSIFAIGFKSNSSSSCDRA